MTIREAKAAGKAHYEQNKKLTPCDCGSFDNAIFDYCHQLGLNDLESSKMYEALRGAFDHAWYEAEAGLTIIRCDERIIQIIG